MTMHRVWAVVTRGTLTVYSAACDAHPYPAGSTFFDPGNVTHTARTEGEEPVNVIATFMFPADAGAASVPQPDPGTCPLHAAAQPPVRPLCARHAGRRGLPNCLYLSDRAARRTSVSHPSYRYALRLGRRSARYALRTRCALRTGERCPVTWRPGEPTPTAVAQGQEAAA